MSEGDEENAPPPMDIGMLGFIEFDVTGYAHGFAEWYRKLPQALLDKAPHSTKLLGCSREELPEAFAPIASALMSSVSPRGGDNLAAARSTAIARIMVSGALAVWLLDHPEGT